MNGMNNEGKVSWVTLATIGMALISVVLAAGLTGIGRWVATIDNRVFELRAETVTKADLAALRQEMRDTVAASEKRIIEQIHKQRSP